jgi:hypothetical protein
LAPKRGQRGPSLHGSGDGVNKVPLTRLVTDSKIPSPHLGAREILVKSGLHLKTQIPTRGFRGRHKIKNGIYVELREALSEMKIGESSEWPVRCEDGVRVIARRLGIKVVSRRLGRLDKITVYRIE